jgi:hypothetical protein
LRPPGQQEDVDRFDACDESLRPRARPVVKQTAETVREAFKSSGQRRRRGGARPPPSRVWLAGGPARWHREVRRSDDVASGRALSAPVAAADAD